jgi:hypothetical protein
LLSVLREPCSRFEFATLGKRFSRIALGSTAGARDAGQQSVC